MERILNKIQKKIDQIEKLHDKESLLCEEVKDLIEEIREDNVEESIEADDLDDEEKVRAAEEKYNLIKLF